jgi:hypothetical protein
MNTIGNFLLWCLLLVICWPLALLALVLAPLVWLIALPFRLLGVCVTATFAFIKALLFLPARLLGHVGLNRRAGASRRPEACRPAAALLGLKANRN